MQNGRLVPNNRYNRAIDPQEIGIDCLLNVTQACQVLGICERLLRKLVAEDRIDYLKIGRSIRFSRSRLEKWIEEGGTK
jgi:excisionase family DNA binding protein